MIFRWHHQSLHNETTVDGCDKHGQQHVEKADRARQSIEFQVNWTKRTLQQQGTTSVLHVMAKFRYREPFIKVRLKGRPNKPGIILPDPDIFQFAQKTPDIRNFDEFRAWFWSNCYVI